MDRWVATNLAEPKKINISLWRREPKRNKPRGVVLLLLLSRFSRVRLCATPQTAAHQALPSLGFSRQERWSGLPFPSPMHESEKWKWSRSVVSDFSRPHGLQPTGLLRPWDFPGKRTGVVRRCLLLGSCEILVTFRIGGCSHLWWPLCGVRLNMGDLDESHKANGWISHPLE